MSETRLIDANALKEIILGKYQKGGVKYDRRN